MQAIAENSLQDEGHVFEYSSETQPISSVWSTKSILSNGFLSSFFLANGNCQYLGSRTGDYSGAQVDPSDSSSFWIAGERVNLYNLQNVTGFPPIWDCAWQTWIGRLQP